MNGYWCLHCARASVSKKVRKVIFEGETYRECPHCGADEWDLWKIKGEFTHGEEIEKITTRPNNGLKVQFR